MNGQLQKLDLTAPVKEGDYNITLAEPFETDVGTYHVLRFPFTYDDIKGDVVPNYFDLFDVSPTASDKEREIFNSRASKIKACFLLAGSFNPQNYSIWAGKKGKVRVGVSKNGFTNVLKFYNHPELEMYKQYL